MSTTLAAPPNEAREKHLAKLAAEQLFEDTRRCAMATAYMEKHYRKGPGLKQIAKASGWSAFHFHRRYTALLGETPKDVLTRLQVAEAKRRMLAGVALADVAHQVGFAHQSHFTSRFKQVEGQTPSRWLRDQKAAAFVAEGGGK